MLKILQPGADDGGTRFGSSLYESSLKCPKRAGYNFDNWTPGVEDFGDEGALAIGSYYHKFLEAYHGGTLPNKPIRVSDLGGNDAATEAHRLFKWYSTQIKPDFFGEVLGVEEAITEDHPNWDAVCKAVGDVQFTLKADMVVRCDRAALARLSKRGCTASREGVYIVDHKTCGRRDRLAQQKYEMGIQARAYPVALEAAMGEPCEGIIFSRIYKTKEPGHELCFVPTVRGEELEGLQHTMRNAYRMFEIGFANPMWCFDYGKTCELMEKGQCKGY